MELVKDTPYKKQFNPLHPMCPFERELKDGHYISTNKWKPGFEWIEQDPTTVAFEIPKGTACGYDILQNEKNGSKARMMMAFSRRMYGLEPGSLLSAITMWSQDKFFSLPNRNEVGTHFGIATRDRFGYNRFYTLEALKSKVRCTQFNHQKKADGTPYPKDPTAISIWLKEDLRSRMDEAFSDFSNAKNNYPYGITTVSEQDRPYGIMFTNKEGRYARVTCDMFDWFYNPEPTLSVLELNKKEERREARRARWNSLSVEEQERIKAESKRRSAEAITAPR